MGSLSFLPAQPSCPVQLSRAWIYPPLLGTVEPILVLQAVCVVVRARTGAKQCARGDTSPITPSALSAPH